MKNDNKQIFVAAKGLILNDKNEFLILKQNLKDGFHVWDSPGGKVEFGESLKDCLIREVMEELRVKINVKQIIGTYQFTKINDGKFVVCVVFVAHLENPKVVLELDPQTRISEYRWITKEDFFSNNYKVSDPSFIEMLRNVSF